MKRWTRDDMIVEGFDREKVARTERALHILPANIPLWMLEEIRIQHRLCKKNQRRGALLSLALLREVCLRQRLHHSQALIWLAMLVSVQLYFTVRNFGNSLAPRSLPRQKGCFLKHGQSTDQASLE